MVDWNEDTLDRLADIYVAEPDPAARDAIARCVEQINRRLAADPWSPGESRGTARRVWFHPPRVEPDDGGLRLAAGRRGRRSPRPPV
jgi:hypothetical protein